jgi:hypothetical protein
MGRNLRVGILPGTASAVVAYSDAQAEERRLEAVAIRVNKSTDSDSIKVAGYPRFFNPFRTRSVSRAFL